MPGIDGELSRHHRGTTSITIIKNIQQGLGISQGQTVAEPIIQDQQIGLGKRLDQTGIVTLQLSGFDLLEEARQAEVADGEILLTGSPAKRTGDERFSCPGGAENDQVESFADPGILGQLQHELTLQAPFGREINILDHRGLLETGLTETAAQAVVLALDMLLFDQQCQAFLKGEFVIMR